MLGFYYYCFFFIFKYNRDSKMNIEHTLVKFKNESIVDFQQLPSNIFSNQLSWQYKINRIISVKIASTENILPDQFKRLYSFYSNVILLIKMMKKKYEL